MRRFRRRLRRLRPPRATDVRWLFLRGLGLTGVVAFRSLRRQVLGLYGARGIVPLNERLTWLRERLGRERYLRFPTVLWLGASDRAMLNACRIGEGASWALLGGIAPRLSTAVLWGTYLSFVSVGQPFLLFQWDALLLEAGVLALLTAPGGLRPGRGRHPPSWATVLMFRWLAFRLHFESGIAKLQSKDEAWRNLTATAYHHETQPLPSPLSWYARQFPPAVNKVGTLWVLLTETLVPPLLLLPSRARRFAFWNLTALQGAITATGNFGFFNLLSEVVLLWGLDDQALAKLARRRRRPSPTRAPTWRDLLELVAVLPLAASSIDELVARFRPVRAPRLLRKVIEAPRSFQAVNPYGLFAVMTTTRPEIVVEGSADGERWIEYGFRYKPGNPKLRARSTGFHMPRLDWQMWFAALQPVPGWLPMFLGRLLQGSPEVRALLGTDPFPGEPPRHVRATLYLYRMTDRDTRRRTGEWWQRERVARLVTIHREEPRTAGLPVE